MVARSLAIVCALLAGVLATGCRDDTDDAALPGPCVEARAVRAALAAAPAPVHLPDGTRLARCVELARSDSELTSLGVVLTGVADGLADVALADAALAGRTAAATELGYLIGAAQRGSRRGQGIQVELARRLEGAARRIDGTAPAIDAALRRGAAAGEQAG